MNCPQCDYLLWELSDNRCPECATTFETTDYAFPAGQVHFLCGDCGQSYLGTDERGLPSPRRFDCVGCGRSLDAATLTVHPTVEGVRGRATRLGTPWEHRDQVGFVPAFLDGVARIATQPAEYYRQCYEGYRSGAVFFSVLCAYAAAGVLLAAGLLASVIGWRGRVASLEMTAVLKFLLIATVMVPLIQLTWNYLYGFLIHGVLLCLGRRDAAAQRSVHAVAYGSAVLPALVLLPPIGLVWYVSVVASGVEHLHGTTRGQAVAAAALPVLLAANAGAVALFMIA